MSFDGHVPQRAWPERFSLPRSEVWRIAAKFVKDNNCDLSLAVDAQPRADSPPDAEPRVLEQRVLGPVEIKTDKIT